MAYRSRAHRHPAHPPPPRAPHLGRVLFYFTRLARSGPNDRTSMDKAIAAVTAVIGVAVAYYIYQKKCSRDAPRGLSKAELDNALKTVGQKRIES